MDIKKQLKAIISEAEIYRTQGLFLEAKEKYKKASDIVKANDQIKNKQNILYSILEKLNNIEKDIAKINKVSTQPKLPKKIQKLIKDLFSFSESSGKDFASFEGAIALAKFGQFNSALKEFNKLLKISHLRVVTAKNMLRCHVINSNFNDAVEQYKQWYKSNLFPPEQLEKVRLFLQGMIDKKGLDVKLEVPEVKEKPAPAEPKAPAASKEKPPELPKKGGAKDIAPPAVETPKETNEEDLLDISSIGLILEEGPNKGQQIELDVSFQSGNIISLIVSKDDQELIDLLEVGYRLNNVQFYSPIAIFEGSGVISSKAMIESGPKRGDYSLDIEIVSS